MAYNLSIWEDMTKEEREAYKIYEVFRIYAYKHSVINQTWLPSAESKTCCEYERDGKYPADKIREHKNWPIFMATYEIYQNDELFDPYLFMESIFRAVGKAETIYPGMLKTKIAKNRYYEYRQNLSELSKEVSKIEQLQTNIIGTYKLIQLKTQKIDLTYEVLNKFFNSPKKNALMSEGILLCIYQMLSPYYLVVSKSFEQAYYNTDIDIQNEILSRDKYQYLQSFVKINSRLYNFIKRAFREDIIEI